MIGSEDYVITETASLNSRKKYAENYNERLNGILGDGKTKERWKSWRREGRTSWNSTWIHSL